MRTLSHTILIRTTILFATAFAGVVTVANDAALLANLDTSVQDLGRITNIFEMSQQSGETSHSEVPSGQPSDKQVTDKGPFVPLFSILLSIYLFC